MATKPVVQAGIVITILVVLGLLLIPPIFKAIADAIGTGVTNKINETAH